jgi:hypothetical protein
MGRHNSRYPFPPARKPSLVKLLQPGVGDETCQTDLLLAAAAAQQRVKSTVAFQKQTR